MNKSNRRRRESPAKSQRFKLLLIPILLLVLGYVLWPAADEEEGVAPAATAAGAKEAVKIADEPASASGSVADGAKPAESTEAAWPTIRVDELGVSNPFLPIHKKPTASEIAAAEVAAGDAEALAALESTTDGDEHLVSTPAVDTSAQQLSALSQQPVHYFFQSQAKRVMLVGEQLLSEGETLNKYRISRLQPNEMLLEPVAAGAPQADVDPGVELSTSGTSEDAVN